MNQKTFLAILLVFMPVLLLTTAPRSNAQPVSPERRCFDETGHCITGAILSYWEQNGGIPVFGYPITNLQEETIVGDNGVSWTGPVQWFERDRLEDHGSEGVMAGRLGAKILELQGTPWYTFPQVSSAAEGCLFFQATGHSLCEPFRSYWEQNGGLERFGYPITEPHERTLDGEWTGTVQYFERRRMEHHTDNAGTPYEVLLGLLGNEVRDIQASEPAPCGTVISELQDAHSRIEYFADQMGCPTTVYRDRPAAIQNLERGQMIWVNYSDDMKKIYAIWSNGRYKEVNDTWTEDMGEKPDVDAPSGLHVPKRGFGKAWIDDPVIREGLGYAVEENEREETATVQMFQSGRLIWLHGPDKVYALGPDEWHVQILSR